MSVTRAVECKTSRAPGHDEAALPTRRSTRLSSACSTDVLEPPPKKQATRRKRRRNDQPRPTRATRATKSASPVNRLPSRLNPPLLNEPASASLLPARPTAVQDFGHSESRAAELSTTEQTIYPAAKGGKQKADAAASGSFNDPAIVTAINHHADVAENVLFASRAIEALGLDGSTSVMGMRLLLIRFNREAGGDESDPIFKVLTDQIAITHQRIGKLDADAERVSSFEGKRLYLDAAAKLRSELRKMMEAVSTYRRSKRRPATGATTPKGRPQTGKRAKTAKPRNNKGAHRTRE